MKTNQDNKKNDDSSSVGHTPSRKQPVYTVGLLDNENDYGVWNEVPQVVKPNNLPLSSCYQWIDKGDGYDLANRANVHLLAAIGKIKKPFVPVRVPVEYRSHSWADLPAIEEVQLEVGNTLHASQSVWVGELICVESLALSATTSDGRIFQSPVCIAVKLKTDEDYQDGAYDVYVTPEAARSIEFDHIFSLLGGNYDPFETGDIYDMQYEEYKSDLRKFWLDTSGPDEYLRQSFMDLLSTYDVKWQSIKVQPDGQVSIKLKNGKTKKLQRPKNFPFPRPLDRKVRRINISS